MFKNRQKQEDTVTAPVQGNSDEGAELPVKKQKQEDFDKEYLERHKKYKQDHILNPEFDPKDVVTGDDDLLVRKIT